MTYLFIGFLVIVIALVLFTFSGIQLPKNINTLIQEVQKSEIPKLIKGKTGLAKNGDLTIFYELIKGNNTSKKGTILLICGHTQTLLDWYPYFYQPLIDEGYQVIRFDNRGLGQSDWLREWGKPKKYSLEDMATDGLAVLDHLGIEKAHIIGMSMGGMIAQRLAISHANRVLSLTSIMSTGFFDDPDLINIPEPFFRDLVRLTLRYIPTIAKEESKLKFHLGLQRMLKGKGDYPFDDKMIVEKALYEIRERNGFNRKTTAQHSYAIRKSGSRYEELKTISVPTLVIHGTTDPLVVFEHAQKYSPMIPNVKNLFIEDMGHDLPLVHVPIMMENIFKNLNLAKATI